MSATAIVEATFLAFIPTLLYALLIWWLDRHEKEPKGLLLVAFLWGAVPAIILAIILSLASRVPLQALITSEGVLRIAEAGLVAPIVEEAVKGIILVFLFLAFRREFDNVLDGIVYGALVGLGFAFVENVLYLAGEASRTGTDGMVRLWLLRAGLFGLNHSMFTALTGAALGFARSLPGGAMRGFVGALGMGAAMIMHALHNTLVTAPGVLATGADAENAMVAACLGAVAADWGGVLLVFILATISSVREGRIIREQLMEEVALGRITPYEYETLSSGGRRWGARWSALMRGGFGRWRKLGRFFDLATELAFRKHRRTEGRPHHQATNAEVINRLRWEIDYHKWLMLGGQGPA
jgi:protease PrsW